MKLSDQITRRHLFVAFGSSMQTGSLSSVDLAATRDESSVTLTASDGSVAPIAGADASTAGVLTAADKVRLDGMPPATGRRFSARSEVASAPIGAGITHLITAGYAAAGDGGGAVYKRATAEPSHALKVQSADGAWWELVPVGGVIHHKQAGAVYDGVTDDKPAFQACLDFAALNTSGGESAMFTIQMAGGTTHFASHVNVKVAVSIKGAGAALGAAPATKITFPSQTTGFIFHEPDTIDATTTTAGGSGTGSVLENVRLVGGGGTIAGVTDGTKGHGVWLRTQASILACFIEEFAGDGLHVVADVSGIATKGAANLWHAVTCTFKQNHRHGLLADGDNANAGRAIGCNASGNGRWGFFASTSSGNNFVGCHAYNNGTASSGNNAADQSSIVEFGGNFYAAHRDATEAALVATQPGTNAGVWIDLGAGTSSASRPTWQSGQAEGTYFHGGPYGADSSVATHVFLGNYAESPMNQGPVQMDQMSLWLGGETAGTSGIYGQLGGFVMEANRLVGLGGWAWPNHFKYSVESGSGAVASRQLTRRINENPDELDAWDIEGDGGYQVDWDEGNGALILHHNGSTRIHQIQSSLSPAFGGRSGSPSGGELLFPNGFWLGGTGFTGAVRKQSNGTAAPTGGEWARGDIVWNRDPSAGGKVGWVCVSGGTPGTWKAFGAIDA